MKITDKITIIKGDCLEKMKEIESGSVDLILTDPPYGTMKDINKEFKGYGRKNHDGHSWDNVLPYDLMWEQINRVLRKNGKCILFSQEPFTSNLIKSAIPNVPFSYRNVWLKDNFANALLVNKAPVNYYEDICVFSKLHDMDELHPLRDYAKEVYNFIGLNKKQIIDKIGKRADHFFRVDSTQFSLCTEKTYNELIKFFCIDKMKGFKTFKELEEVNSAFNSVFNLWQGKKYKSNVFEYKKDYDCFHPTQKPVLLLEDLIKTYSNEKDTILDFTMGSGSTGVACVNTKRKFIGIELDENYFNIAKERIKNHVSQQKLF